MTEDRAETIALAALGFLATDDARLQAFMVNTGLTIEDLKARATDREVMVSVLDAILEDESALLMFAAERHLDPAEVYPARIRLGGTYETSA